MARGFSPITVPGRLNRIGVERAREIAAELLAEIKRRTPHRQPVYEGRRSHGRRVETQPGGALEDAYDSVPIPEGAAIVNPLRYWMFVEFGTAEHGEAQSHVRTAIEAVRARHRGGLR